LTGAATDNRAVCLTAPELGGVVTYRELIRGLVEVIEDSALP
jgi:hypothetical protein